MLIDSRRTLNSRAKAANFIEIVCDFVKLYWVYSKHLDWCDGNLKENIV